MVSNFLDENNVPLPEKLTDLLAWFPADNPEPAVEVSQADVPGELWLLAISFMPS